MARPSREVGTRIRRTMIDISLRRQRPGHGSGSLQPDSAYLIKWPDLSDVLQGVPWAVAGGVATRRYMPERATPALDVVVLERHQARAESLLAAAGYVREGRGESHWLSPEGVAVHVIPLRDPWAEQALEAAAANPGADGLPVLPLAYLILMKMHAMHMQDLADIERMLAAASPAAREQVRATVERFEPDFVQDFDSIVVLAKRTTGEE